MFKERIFLQLIRMEPTFLKLQPNSMKNSLTVKIIKQTPDKMNRIKASLSHYHRTILQD